MTIYNDNIARPYVYKITFIDTGGYYFGYREANLRRNVPARFDIGVRYFTSSDKIHNMGFKKCGDAKVIIEILREFTKKDVKRKCDTPGDAANDYEQKLIGKNFDDPLCLNENWRPRNGRKRFKSKKGIPNPNKGKKLEEIIGEERAKELKIHKSNCAKEQMKNGAPDETRNKIRRARKNQIISAESNLKRSTTLKENYYNHSNYDPTNYLWFDIRTSMIIYCTRYKLVELFPELVLNALSPIILNKKLRYKNWYILTSSYVPKPKKIIYGREPWNKGISIFNGAGNPNNDPTIYEWQHKIHGGRNCTRYDLVKEFPELTLSALSPLIRNKKKKYKGWYVILTKESIKLSNQRANKNKGKRDNTPYHWYNKDYGYEFLSRYDLAERYPKLRINTYELMNVIKQKVGYNNHRGWYLVKTINSL